MKIVINAYSARLGGGQTYLRNLLEHLPNRPDLKIQIFAPPSLELPIHPNLRRVHTHWPTTNPILRAVWEKVVLPVYLRREQANVLFCPGGLISTHVPIGCKSVTMFRNMIPFDARVRGSIPWGLQRARNWILQRVMLKSMATADLTIFISAYARQVIETLTSIRNPVTIPHGISDSFRTCGRTIERPPMAPAGEYLLYVSRFDIYKHHAQIVDGYAKLPESLRLRFPLLLAGESDSVHATAVRQQVERLNLQTQVFILGPVQHTQLAALYRHAHAIIFASSCENCPNILLESLGAGRPVLSSNVMPMPEFGGDDLAYFSPFDSDDFSRLLHRVLTDTEYANRIAKAALVRSNRYDWSNTAQETWNQLFHLIDQT